MYDSELESRIAKMRGAYMSTLIEEATLSLLASHDLTVENVSVQKALMALCEQPTEDYRLHAYEDAAVVYGLLCASGGDLDSETLSSCTSAVISLVNAALRDNEKELSEGKEEVKEKITAQDDDCSYTLVDRIFKLMGAKYGAKQALAKYLGILPMQVSDWKTGRGDSYNKYTAQIAEYFGVTEEWLLGGCGAESTCQSSDSSVPVTLERILQLVGTQHGAQHKFCQAIGVGDSVIQNWKVGYNTSYRKHLPKIAELYGVSVDWLLGVTDSLDEGGAVKVTCSKPETIAVVRARIFSIMAAKKLSRASLCRSIGKPECTPSRWRRGSTSYMSCIPELAKYLGVEVEWLLRPRDAGESLELPSVEASREEHAYEDKTMERVASCISNAPEKKRELAAALGITYATVNAWMAERNKGYLNRLPEIAEYYGVSLDWLSGCQVATE